YYLSLQAEIPEPEKYSLTDKQVGIDVGVADFAILSNELKYPSFNSSYFEKKAKIWQKKYSRRRHLAKLLVLQDRNKSVLCPRSLESFTNWQKAQKSKAKCQAKAANQR
ncbi:transposase, partial [Lactobacillus helveticus]|nr:transposase [Lactobacillus helveticus]